MDQCLKLADWNGFRRAARTASGAASCAARRRLRPTSSSAASSTSAWRSASIRAAWSRSSPARIRTDRDTRPPSRSSSPSGSACRSRRSTTSRAIPRRCVRPRHLRRAQFAWSAATDCASPPTPSSPEGKEMAGALMEAAPGDIEFSAGTFTVMGTDKSMSIGDVARAFFAPAGPVLKLGLGLDGVGTWSACRAARPITRTAARCAKSRSIRKPAKCISIASSRSTTSAW